jgi:hypothetical protein
MTPAVYEAVENLYKTFSNVPRPTTMPTCTCCLNEEDAKIILTTSLRDIALRDISRYIWAAFLTVGSLPDYLYLLPRIAELAILSDDDCGLPLELTWEKPNLAQWETWDEKYKSALIKYVDAVCNAFAETEILDVASWIEGFLYSFPMHSRLDTLLKDTPAARRNLWILHNEIPIVFNGDNRFRDRPLYQDDFDAWINQPLVQERFREVCIEFSEDEDNEAFKLGRLPYPPTPYPDEYDEFNDSDTDT